MAVNKFAIHYNERIRAIFASIVQREQTSNTTDLGRALCKEIITLARNGDAEAESFHQDRELEGYRLWVRSELHRTAALISFDNQGHKVALPAAIGVRGRDYSTGQDQAWFQQVLWQEVTWDQMARKISDRRRDGDQALAQANRMQEIYDRYYNTDTIGPWDAITQAGDDPAVIFGVG